MVNAVKNLESNFIFFLSKQGFNYTAHQIFIFPFNKLYKIRHTVIAIKFITHAVFFVLSPYILYAEHVKVHIT
jgi:hypothetical protein